MLPQVTIGMDNDFAATSTETLEQRVQRLEDAVASLQDTRLVEDRVVERLGGRLNPQTAPAAPAVADNFMEAPASPPPQFNNMLPSQELPPRMAAAAPLFFKQAWLVLDVYTELRAMIRMFFDVRYHVGWSARLTVLVLVPFILTSHWLIPMTGFWIIGPLFDKIVDLVLAFFVYKALSREAQRYLQTRSARPL